MSSGNLQHGDVAGYASLAERVWATGALAICSMTASNAAVSAAAAEADRVVKRQKLCSTKFSSTIDDLLDMVNSSKVKMQQNPTDAAAMIGALKQQIAQLNVSGDLHDQTKQLHSAIGKLGKVCATGYPVMVWTGRA